MEQISLAVALFSVLISIATFTLGDNKNPTLRYGLGAFFFLVFIVFGLIALYLYIDPILEKSSDAEDLIDCSSTTELGPWQNPTNVTINPDRDGWVQADFWYPEALLNHDYDEVSVIFEPGLRVNVNGVAGIAWKYDRTWSKENVELCTQKHVEDSWNIREKRLKIITPQELCMIVSCS